MEGGRQDVFVVVIIFKHVLIPHLPFVVRSLSSSFTSLTGTVEREALPFHTLKNLLKRGMRGVVRGLRLRGALSHSFLNCGS